MRLLLIAAVVSGGCGSDMRLNFSGGWSGYETFAVQTPTGPLAGQQAADLHVDRAADDGRIVLTDFCGGLTAVVESETDAVLDGRACPRVVLGGCAVTGTVKEGRAVRNGPSLVVTWSGEAVVTDCEQAGAGAWEGTLHVARPD